MYISSNYLAIAIYFYYNINMIYNIIVYYTYVVRTS